MLVALILCFGFGLVLGMPLLFLLISSTITPSLINPSFIGNVQYVIRSIVGGGDNTPILAMPCFILSGVIMSRGGISKRIFDVFAYIFGKMPGTYLSIFWCYLWIRRCDLCSCGFDDYSNFIKSGL